MPVDFGADYADALAPWSTPSLTIFCAAVGAMFSEVAVLVYDKLGVDVLRRAWLNVDLLWAVAVVAAGVVTLFT